MGEARTWPTHHDDAWTGNALAVHDRSTIGTAREETLWLRDATERDARRASWVDVRESLDYTERLGVQHTHGAAAVGAEECFRFVRGVGHPQDGSFEPHGSRLVSHTPTERCHA